MRRAQRLTSSTRKEGNFMLRREFIRWLVKITGGYFAINVLSDIPPLTRVNTTLFSEAHAAGGSCTQDSCTTLDACSGTDSCLQKDICDIDQSLNCTNDECQKDRSGQCINDACTSDDSGNCLRDSCLSDDSGTCRRDTCQEDSSGSCKKDTCTTSEIGRAHV